MTKVAINGFGRIGRLAFRQMLMVRKLLFMLCLTLLSCLGASWVLM